MGPAMELSSEDSLRLNVLLANQPQAIRIDESKLVVYGLSDNGELSVPLHPTGRAESYLRLVRELISGHILGSPGGYPVYLRRWTRMGQMRDQSLEQLLMLGEPEAVVAAVCSPGLTAELARRAWWAMEDAENARRMLANPVVTNSPLGAELADYLIEFLPFETDSEAIMDSVSLVLQPGLIDLALREDLWRKAGRKQVFLVGFLRALPDDLPDPMTPRTDCEPLKQNLVPLAAAGNPVARLLLRCISGAGQRFLDTLSRVLAKPPNQDVVTAAFELMREYFSQVRAVDEPALELAELQADADAFASTAAPDEVRVCLECLPRIAPDIVALRLLSGVGYATLRPVLPDPTTLGTLMRRKLTPVIDPLQAAIACLRDPSA